jgi:regulator of protease activity HflC (stomatin/prohibitin superfamily)
LRSAGTLTDRGFVVSQKTKVLNLRDNLEARVSENVRVQDSATVRVKRIEIPREIKAAVSAKMAAERDRQKK